MDVRMDVNEVRLCGRIASAPEVRVFDSGTQRVRFLVASRVDEPRSRIDVIPVTMWNPNDDQIPGQLVVSDRVWVTGSVQRRLHDGPQGRRSSLEVIGHEVTTSEPPDWASSPIC